MNSILKDLKEADHSIQKASHLLNVTFPLLKHKKILIKIVEEIKNSLLKQITAILYYEDLKKNIRLSKDSKRNLEIFRTKLAKKYKINNKKLQEIINISRIQKDSAIHILKEDKLILISKELKQKDITKELLEEYIKLVKDLFVTINKKMVKTPIKE